DDAAQVTAANDINVIANGKEAIISVVAGASGGTVRGEGTLTVTILKVPTFACTGSWTGDTKGCANAPASALHPTTLSAGNNVAVGSRDETTLTLITASLAGGFVGVGVAVGVASVSKDTEAFIG